MIFHKIQHYSINVLCAVIHGFVPVWIDGGDVFVCGCVWALWGSLWGGQSSLQRRSPEIDFLKVI